MSTNSNQHCTPKLCFVCKDMFGNPTFNQMCSKCFKDAKNKENKKKVQSLEFAKKETQGAQKEEPIKLALDENQGIFSKGQCINLTVQETKKSQNKQKNQKPKEQIQKCFNCNKKVGLLGYKCRHCEHQFCKKHRIPEDHQCKVDFITIGKQKLTQQNPVVALEKVQKI